MGDELIIGGNKLRSRLFIGTGKYSSDALIPEIITIKTISHIFFNIKSMSLFRVSSIIHLKL